MKNKFILTLIFGLFICSLGAQEVHLEVPGNREVEPAYRLSQQPQLIDTIIPTSKIQYPLLALKYETSFALDTIKSAKIKMIEELSKLYPGYVRIGIGNKIVPLAEVYYGSTRSRKYVYDVYFKQLNSLAKIKNYAPAQYSQTALLLKGKLNERKYSLNGGLDLESQSLHQYGLKRPDAPADSIAQRFTSFGLNLMYLKHKKDSNSLNYAFGGAYNYFQDKKPTIDSLSPWFSKENALKLNGKIWYKFRKEILRTDLDLLYNSYHYGPAGDSLTAVDTALTFNNLQVILSPNITTYARDNRLKIKFGAKLALDLMDDLIQPKSKLYVYPDIELKYAMFNDILIPYLNVSGGLKQQSLKALSRQNEFVLSQVRLASENQVVEGKLGLKGTLSNKIMFNTNVSFGIVKNKALFVQDTLYARGNQFRVIYDDVNEASVFGSLSYQLNEQIKIEGIGIFNSYQASNNIFAWNLPRLDLRLRGAYTFAFPLTLKLESRFLGGRYAQVYTAAESDYEENQQFAKKLGLLMDFNLSAEYRYTKRFSAFVEFNNFAAQKYLRWYDYPVLGFQVFGGVSFRF